MFTPESFVSALSYFLGLTGQLILMFVGITFFVGLIQEYVNPEALGNKLGHWRQGAGNILGAFLGALTPFCTCSTIPITVGMLKAGVPFGITMSFFFASPLLNPIIIGLMLLLFGVKVTLVYVGILFPVSVIIGMVLERLGYAQQLKIEIPPATSPCCKQSEELQGGCSSNQRETNKNTAFLSRLSRAGVFAWNLFRQVFVYLVLGAAIGAAIREFVPQDLVVAIAGPDNRFAILIAAVIGIPMYIRGATMLPISAVLISQGMSVGAVMALIIGGAGASLPELTMLTSIYKPKLLFTYLATIIGVAIAAGYLFNWLV